MLIRWIELISRGVGLINRESELKNKDTCMSLNSWAPSEQTLSMHRATETHITMIKKKRETAHCNVDYRDRHFHQTPRVLRDIQIEPSVTTV